MGTFELLRFDEAGPLAQAAAVDWLNEIPLNPTGRLFFTALSGGRIARYFFSAVAAQVKARQVSLGAARFFWSDERCVPPTDPESNFRAAQELLFAAVNVAVDHIHRVRGEDPPEKAAVIAEAELRSLVSATFDDQPVLDLVFLGMGEDGHVASLFPREPEEVMTSCAIFRCVKASKPPPLRITLGYPALAVARQVWVLASGPGKEAALRESLKLDGQTPLARLVRLRSFTRIYTDCKI
jgi:6-phosphogluconolactonase